MKSSRLRMLSCVIVVVMLIISSHVNLLAEMSASDPSHELQAEEQLAPGEETELEDSAETAGIATDADADSDAEPEITEVAKEATTAPILSPSAAIPLRVGIADVQGDFNIIFSEITSDRMIADLTQLETLTNDRAGELVFQGIEGEIRPYNGVDYSYFGPANLDIILDEANNSSSYTWTLRNDLKFSDGTPLTVDDLIFTFYVLADPSYDGPNTFNTLPIRGMNEYRTQTTSLVYEKYALIWDEIVQAGPDHELPEVSWTKGMEDRVWSDLETAALEGIDLVIDYVDTKYTDTYAEDLTGKTAEEVRTENLETAIAMSLWGFGKFVFEDSQLVTGTEETTAAETSEGTNESSVAIGYRLNDKSWDFRQGARPTKEDFLQGALELYGGDYAAFMQAETASVGGKQANKIKEEFISSFGSEDKDQAGGVPNIAGISRLSETQVEIVLNGYDASAVYKQIVPIAPHHIYGDPELYDHESNQYGFEFGDLSKIKAQSDQPVGAGPYVFQGYEDGAISFEANPYFYRGEPQTKLLQFIETDQDDMITAVKEDRLDISEPIYTKSVATEIEESSETGGLTTNSLSTAIYDDLGYGYIGLNAATINVAGEPSSEASKNLRRALATILAAQRTEAIDAYFGDAARVIEYPISSTSWASPQSSDEGYQLAYANKLDGEAIYTPGMDELEHTKATLQAATDYLLAAGFTQEDGKFTEAPEGAKLAYEVLIPGSGTGDHPAFQIVEKAAEQFAAIGIQLTIVDLEKPDELWERLQTGNVELWCASWEGSLDPDLYQVYHSSNRLGEGGTGSNYYNLADDHLDELIMVARSNSDQVFRKDIYHQALEIILDWAVEVPLYQRQRISILSGERIDMGTVTSNQTSFYNWLNEIQNIEMQ